MKRGREEGRAGWRKENRNVQREKDEAREKEKKRGREKRRKSVSQENERLNFTNMEEGRVGGWAAWRMENKNE